MKMKPQDAFLVVATFIALTLIVSHNCQHYHHQRIYYRTLNESIITTYIIDDNGYTFNESKEWCDQLGGQLPIFHSQEEFDFLMDLVVIKGSPGHCDNTWVGRRPVSRKQYHLPKTWLDGSPIDYNFTSWGDRTYCKDDDCCGLYVSNTLDRRTVWFSDCSSRHRKVCQFSRLVTSEEVGLTTSNSLVIEEIDGSESVAAEGMSTSPLKTLFIVLLVIAVALFILILITVRQLAKKTREKENMVVVTGYTERDHFSPAVGTEEMKMRRINGNLYEPVHARQPETSTFVS